MRDFIEAVASGADPTPSFADGLQVQQVLDAVSRSADTGSSWMAVAPALAETAAG
jgi:predicted dehydrogenase